MKKQMKSLLFFFLSENKDTNGILKKLTSTKGIHQNCSPPS